jgi:hypothetical protein
VRATGHQLCDQGSNYLFVVAIFVLFVRLFLVDTFYVVVVVSSVLDFYIRN